MKCHSRPKNWKCRLSKYPYYRRGSTADLTSGTQWKVRLNPPTETPLTELVTHFLDNVNNLFDHVLEDVGDADMVGIIIHNEVNQSEKSIGFSFRRKDQLSSDVIWSVFDKLPVSKAKFNATDTLIVMANSVTMPVVFGGDGMKRKGGPLASIPYLK